MKDNHNNANMLEDGKYQLAKYLEAIKYVIGL